MADVLATNLAAFRAERGLSRRELAVELEQVGMDLPSTAIGKIERREREVKVDELIALALVLNVAPPELLIPRADPADHEDEDGLSSYFDASHLRLAPDLKGVAPDAARDWMRGRSSIPVYALRPMEEWPDHRHVEDRRTEEAYQQANPVRDYERWMVKDEPAVRGARTLLRQLENIAVQEEDSLYFRTEPSLGYADLTTAASAVRRSIIEVLDTLEQRYERQSPDYPKLRRPDWLAGTED